MCSWHTHLTVCHPQQQIPITISAQHMLRENHRMTGSCCHLVNEYEITAAKQRHHRPKTRSSAVAERPRDASCYWISCKVTQDHSRSFETTLLSRACVPTSIPLKLMSASRTVCDIFSDTKQCAASLRQQRYFSIIATKCHYVPRGFIRW